MENTGLNNGYSLDEDIQQWASFRKNIEKRNEAIDKLDKSKVDIQLGEAFGINHHQVRDNLSVVGDTKIVFYTGHVIVLKDMLTKQMAFLQKSKRLENVTALAVKEHQGETTVAAGESSVEEDQQITLSVVTQEKNKWYVLGQSGIKGTFKHLALNPDKQYVGAIVQPFHSPTLSVLVYNYKREKLLAVANIKAQLDQIILHPVKTKNLILLGQNTFKMWEIYFQEKQLKESHISLVTQKVEKENRFLDSCWLQLKQLTLLVLLQNRKILLLQNEQVKKVIEIDQGNLNLLEIQVHHMLKAEHYDDDLDLAKHSSQNHKPAASHQAPTDMVTKIDFCSIQATKTKPGFVLGGTKGVLCFFDLDPKSLSHINTLGFQMKHPTEDYSLVHVDVSDNDSLVTMITQSSQQKQQYWVMNTLEMDSDVQAIQPVFPKGFHFKKVNALSVAKCKTIFATCGEDNFVRIWNYGASSSRAIIQTYFSEEPIGLTIHPSGLQLIVAFVNSFKIFAILADNISFVKEINLTSCKVVRYSHGGQYLLANEKWNIYVYETINYEPIYMLQGPTALIKEIEIDAQDNLIVATCINRYVYMWDLQDENSLLHLKKPLYEEQSIFNGIQVDMQLLSSPTDFFLGCTNEKYLVIMKNQCKNLVAEFATVDCYITAMLVCPQMNMLLLGTNKGTLRVSRWPIVDDQLEMEVLQPTNNQVRFKVPHFIEYAAHSSPITCLQVNNSQTHIFTASEDGNILIYHHNTNTNSLTPLSMAMENEEEPNDIDTDGPPAEKVKNNKQEERDRLVGCMNDFFYNKIPRIQDKNEQIQKLKFEVQQSEKTLNIELSKIEQMFKYQIQQIKGDFGGKKSEKERQLEDFIEKSKDDYASLERNFEENQERFANEISKLETLNEMKVSYEEDRNKQVEDEIQELKEQQKYKLQCLLKKHKDDQLRMKNQYQLKQKKILQKYTTLLDNAKNFGNAFIQRLDKQDEEHERELEDKVKQLQQQIIQQKKINDNLQAKEYELSETHKKNEENDTKLQNELNKLLEEHSEIRAKNLRNDEDIIKMQHQLLERIQVIDGKEETCKNARDEQINLENFRYMLEQKIKMLQGERDQILEKINEKEGNLKNMFNELIGQSSKNQKNYLEFKHNNVKCNILKATISNLDLQQTLCQQVYKNFQTLLLKIIQNPQKMAVTAQQLFSMLEQNHLQQSQKGRAPLNNHLQQSSSYDVNEELLKQCTWMNQKIWLIEDSCEKLKDQREQNINQILSQNTKLIEECNLLRSENDKLKKEYKNVKKLLLEQISKQQALIKKKKNQHSPGKLKELIDKFQENNEKLQNQQNKLASLKNNMNQILDNKLPQI